MDVVIVSNGLSLLNVNELVKKALFALEDPHYGPSTYAISNVSFLAKSLMLSGCQIFTPEYCHRLAITTVAEQMPSWC